SESIPIPSIYEFLPIPLASTDNQPFPVYAPLEMFHKLSLLFGITAMGYSTDTTLYGRIVEYYLLPLCTIHSQMNDNQFHLQIPDSDNKILPLKYLDESFEPLYFPDNQTHKMEIIIDFLLILLLFLSQTHSKYTSYPASFFGFHLIEAYSIHNSF